MRNYGEPVANVKGNNNEVIIVINETPSKTPAAIVIAISAIIIVAILAISFCCPQFLADFVKWIIKSVISS